ncbi:MAG: polysaccharide deacetylase family protein [Pseudomonadota bacterium]
MMDRGYPRDMGMKDGDAQKTPFSPAERIGFGALALALALSLLDLQLSVLPLSAFLLLCFTAPFLPGFSFFLPIISRGRSGAKAVALTFDDGPDPVSTPNLLDLLSRHSAVATFFVTGKNAAAHPGIIEAILSRGHTIGNHTHGHDNFIMLKSSKVLRSEIAATQQVLAHFGVIPLVFRPPVGVTSPRLAAVLRETGMVAVNFSRRARDRGNREVRGISQRILCGLGAGDILMLHDTRPHNAALYHRWLNEIDRVLYGIREKGLAIIPLSTLIDRPVMALVGEASHSRHSSG